MYICCRSTTHRWIAIDQTKALSKPSCPILLLQTGRYVTTRIIANHIIFIACINGSSGYFTYNRVEFAARQAINCQIMENNIRLSPILFSALLILAASAFAFAFFIYRKYKRRLNALEKELEEKKDALQYSILQLESSKTELKNSLAFRERTISIVVHDLKSPLAFLHRIITHLHESHADISRHSLEKLTSEMRHTTYQIAGFVNDLLDWLNSTHVDFSLKPDIKPFNDFLNSKVGVYAEIAKKKGLAFQLKAKPDFILRADFNLLQIVIRNLLDNAIKNTDTGSVSINGYADESNQYIVISDTGVGMNSDKAMELEYGVITKKTNESSQIGFRIVYDMVLKMKGKIKIQSGDGNGTSVSVILPR